MNAFLTTARTTLVPITEKERSLAFEAFGLYGKGTGHPVRLNTGDGFSCASARSCGMPLLFKGDEFAHTDIADAAHFV